MPVAFFFFFAHENFVYLLLSCGDLSHTKPRSERAYFTAIKCISILKIYASPYLRSVHDVKTPQVNVGVFCPEM